MADSVAIYISDLTAARPPQMRRRPLKVPLSRLKGATPTNAASALPEICPNSGNITSKLAEINGPIPLGDCRMRLRSRHSDLDSLSSSIFSSSF